MGPFEINAAYRQQQLLDEAEAEARAREARRGSAGRRLASPLALLDRIVQSVRPVRGRGRVAASRKAST